MQTEGRSRAPSLRCWLNRACPQVRRSPGNRELVERLQLIELAAGLAAEDEAEAVRAAGGQGGRARDGGGGGGGGGGRKKKKGKKKKKR